MWMQCWNVAILTRSPLYIKGSVTHTIINLSRRMLCWVVLHGLLGHGLNSASSPDQSSLQEASTYACSYSKMFSCEHLVWIELWGFFLKKFYIIAWMNKKEGPLSMDRICFTPWEKSTWASHNAAWGPPTSEDKSFTTCIPLILSY